MKKTITILLSLAVIWGIFTGVEYILVKIRFTPVAYVPPSKISSVFPAYSGKNLLHRVNTQQLMAKKIPAYDGAELDVYYKGKRYFAAHDEKDVGRESVKEVLSAAPQLSDKYFWIDLKSPFESLENARNLKKVFEEVGILLDKVIVETDSPSAASLSVEAGFLTALQGHGFDRKYDIEELKENLERTEWEVTASGVQALSCSLTNYPFLRSYFPQMPKIVYYTNNSNPISLKRYFVKKELQKDPMVKMILMD
ncbi:hypothetical protein Dip510_001920 [Elusimicrobium posterum]|uniref:hypothetical protein n=1 Tax=Elusimicrobium posterum TaxID=3116653 RepID=UPI003C79325A